VLYVKEILRDVILNKEVYVPLLVGFTIYKKIDMYECKKFW